MNWNKAILKLIRIQMTDEIKSLLQSLPICDFEESQVGNHIYYGKGKIRLGTKLADSRIVIYRKNSKIMVHLGFSDVRVTHEFNTESDRQECIKVFNNMLNIGWN